MAKVLVVDDRYDNVKLLAFELVDHGYDVVTAFSGAQALEAARDARPDVILLDIMMPGMDGVEVCRHLKNDADLRAIPVIMVSAREMDQDVIRGLDAGAHDYVTKPFNTQIVLARIRSAARAKESHDLIAEMNEQLAELAVTDGLTGIKNHRHFRDSLDVAMSLAVRHEIPLSVIMLDIDHFKSINDAHGHAVGDDVLRTVAKILRENTRDHDEVARYGGEEFAVLLPMTAAAAAFALGERMREAIADHAWPLLRVTASFGVATFPGKTQPRASSLLEQADRALYHSKERGRNRVSHHDDCNCAGSPCAGFAGNGDAETPISVKG